MQFSIIISTKWEGQILSKDNKGEHAEGNENETLQQA
jgi:hypothetical protein